MIYVSYQEISLIIIVLLLKMQHYENENNFHRYNKRAYPFCFV
jgi:hypothetical protein